MSFVLAFIVAQMVPLPAPLIARWTPVRDAFLRQQDVLYALEAPAVSHPLSINPGATIVALACAAAFSLFLLGTARMLSLGGTALAFVRSLVAFGLLLALFALAQNLALAGQTGEGHVVYIYGFWPDPYVNKPFGPFINKNNFAGWMLMAFSLALGYLAAKISRLSRKTRSDWRNRLLSLSSRDGAEVLFAALAAMVMGVSIVASMSRSGMVALAAILAGLAWFMPQSGGAMRRRRFARVAAAALTLAILSAWVGTETIAARFRDRSDASMAGRLIAWKSAAHIIRDFPIVGSGFNTFDRAMLVYQQGDPINFWEEAHNDYLQIVAEGGAVGGALTVLAIGVAAVEIRRRFREESPLHSSYWIRIGAVTGLCAIAVQEIVEFSLQIPANAALFAALVAIALHRSPRVERAAIAR